LRALLADGKRRRTDHLDLFTRLSPSGRSRLVVLVPRYGARAVARNRLRRRLREIARRELLPRLSQPTDLAVRARRSAYGAPFEGLRGELLTVLP
jgi:ribonuclease P protein component